MAPILSRILETELGILVIEAFAYDDENAMFSLENPT
jgi:hypothetical protein